MSVFASSSSEPTASHRLLAFFGSRKRALSHKVPGIMVGMDQKDSYDRDEAQRERGVSTVNADNDSGMWHKPGYSGSDVFPSVVGV